MTNSVIIIPSRLSAKRLLNKPLMEIKGIPMIVHVVNRAKESKVGDVYVATPDAEIVEIVKKHGNEAILTSNNHETGTDRIYEVYSKKINKKIDIIINLQGDMPNIKPESISKLNLVLSCVSTNCFSRFIVTLKPGEDCDKLNNASISFFCNLIGKKPFLKELL